QDLMVSLLTEPQFLVRPQSQPLSAMARTLAAFVLGQGHLTPGADPYHQDAEHDQQWGPNACVAPSHFRCSWPARIGHFSLTLARPPERRPGASTQPAYLLESVPIVNSPPGIQTMPGRPRGGAFQSFVAA